MKSKEKAKIYITDDVRISAYDDRNVTIEILKETTDPKTKETKFSWKLHGYYTSVKHALNGIIKDDLLIDISTIKTLAEYAEYFKRQCEQVKWIDKEEQ